MFLNEIEIDNLQHRLDPDATPNLAKAAQVLTTLVEWTNRNSDGWPYWQKPQRAAKTLTDMLYERDYAIRFGRGRDGKLLEDISEADLKRALTPIKAFLTRQKVSHDSLPWAAVLPAS